MEEDRKLRAATCVNRASAPLAVFGWCFKLRPDKRRLYRAVGDLASMEKTGIREPLNSPIPHPGPLDSAPGPAPTTRGILQNLPATPSPNPTPSTPLGFVAKLTPSWGGQATSGAQALWGRETMAEVAAGGPATGGRLEAELGYGMPVGGRLVGMPSFGIGASGHGRDYRLGYGLTVAQGGATHFDLGVYANRRESLGQGTAEHGVGGQLTARW